MRYLVAVICVLLVVGGCSSDDGELSAEREESVSSVVGELEDTTGEEGDADAVTDAVEDAPDCSELPSPVDVSVLDTGCFQGDEWAPPITMDCGDGTEVILAGDNWAGIEGGEWVEVDPAGDGPFALCP